MFFVCTPLTTCRREAPSLMNPTHVDVFTKGHENGKDWNSKQRDTSIIKPHSFSSPFSSLPFDNNSAERLMMSTWHFILMPTVTVTMPLKDKRNN
ncbi:hypothetical protein TSUD_314220 [Trifolium subterraneum]|uniref:Uncharacterized protein n=1 Tax=Trifolium subterraneum TaxID=3900 RepID=A0A2Z6MTP2_TRISU|nr:hypothetical protein TSUD_314220 [Trifolium subterraneum]